MIKRDLHTHTRYSDGVATPEEMVLAALSMGLDEIGISDHSYTHFDLSYCIPREQIGAYLAEIAALKHKYEGRIVVRCGVEQDLFSQESTAPYDYVIGSSHYIQVGDKYYPIDDSKAGFAELCRVGFGGDYYALAEHYYDQMAAFVARPDVDIVGHLDLIAKYNDGDLFDENDPRYLAAAKRCVDALAAAGKTIEINTGAISRGYRRVPYPADAILDYVRAKGCRLILSSDAHSPSTIAYAFARYEALMRRE